MEDEDFISKTRRKRRMTELQDLGAELVALSREELARLELPEELREAVLDCKRFSKHEAVRRQMQYIGRIMRGLDAAPIAAQLAALKSPSRRDTALFHLAEKWRQDLLDDPGSVDRFVKEFPGVDPQRLRGLIDAAIAERRAARPPRHFRELFHVVNGIVSGHARRA